MEKLFQINITLDMIKKTLSILSLVVLLYSCASEQEKKSSTIARKWQATELVNPQLDSLMNEQRKFLDTFGKNTTDEQNLLIYGITNIDSARTALLKEMDDYKGMQEHSISTTWFDFKDNGIVVMNFSGQKDSSNWKIAEDGNLTLTTINEEENETINMQILELDDAMLKLEMNNGGVSSTVTFKPASE